MAVDIAVLIPLVIAAVAVIMLLKVGGLSAAMVPVVAAMVLTAIVGVTISESMVDILQTHSLDDWQNRREITVNNSSGSAKTSYAVQVSLTSSNFDFGDAQGNGADLRFTDSDGETLLNHWIQSFSSASSTATVWVEVPSIPGNGSTSIYMYYNNPNVSDGQDAGSTFTVFEDWSGDGPFGDISGQATVELRLGQKGGFAGNPIAETGGTGWRQNQVREPSNIVWDSVNSRWYILVSGRDSGNDSAATSYTATSLDGSWTEDSSPPTIPETVVSAGENGVENFHIIRDPSGVIDSAGAWWAWSETGTAGDIYAYKSTDHGDSWAIQNSGNSVLTTGMDTTLNGGASSTDTTITVIDATGSYANDRINVDGEWKYVDSVNGNDITLATALDSDHAGGAEVKSFEAAFVASPSVRLYNGTLYMIYEGAEDATDPETIAHAALATSIDGVNWTKQGAIIAPSMSAGDSNRYQIVFDDTVKIGSTWYGTSHNRGDVDGVTDWRAHVYSTTDDPDAWDRDSWSLVGTNPIEEKIGLVKLVSGGSTSPGVYAVTPDNGNSEVNLARFVGNSTWVSEWVITTEQSEDSVENRDIYVSDNQLALSSTLRVATTTERYHIQLRRTSSPALTNDFAIGFRGKQSSWHRAVMFGNGDPITYNDSFGIDSSQIPALDDGYIAYFKDHSTSTDNIKLSIISSGNGAELTSGSVATSTVQALNNYELRYTNTGGLGTLALVDGDGSIIATVNDNTHLSSNKNIAIGQGEADDASQPGGAHTIDWLYVRPFDGSDPVQTVKDEEAGPWAD